MILRQQKRYEYHFTRQKILNYYYVMTDYFRLSYIHTHVYIWDMHSRTHKHTRMNIRTHIFTLTNIFIHICTHSHTKIHPSLTWLSHTRKLICAMLCIGKHNVCFLAYFLILFLFRFANLLTIAWFILDSIIRFFTFQPLELRAGSAAPALSAFAAAKVLSPACYLFCCQYHILPFIYISMLLSI